MADESPVIAQRVSTPRPNPPVPVTNGRGAPASRRVASARVAASRADEVDPVPDEPAVTYELESDDGYDTDTAYDAGYDTDWARSGWESEPALPAAAPAGRSPSRATLTKSGAAKLAARARAARTSD